MPVAQRIYRLLQRNKIVPIALSGFILLAGLVYSIILGDELRFLPDERDYHLIAENLVRNGVYSLDGLTPTAFRPPGYPLFLAIFYILRAPFVLMRWSNFFLAVFSLWLVWWLVSRWADQAAASLAAILVTGYVVFIYTAGTFYPQTLAATLLLSGVALWTIPQLRLWGGIAGGICFAAMILTVPQYAFIPAVVSVWRVLFNSQNGRRALTAGWLVLVALVGVWVVRNYQVFGDFLMGTNSGINLFVGNSEFTQPGAGRTVDISAFEREAASMSELDADRYFRALALDFIRDHPLEAVGLYFRKLLSFFQYSNQYVTNVNSVQIVDVVMFFTYIPLLLIFFSRYLWFKKIRLSREEVLLHGFYLSSALVMAVFFPRIRFRLPVDYILIMAVAIFLTRFLESTNWFPAWARESQ